MASVVAKQVSLDRRPFQALGLRLSDTFAAEFDLWFFEERWQRIQDEGDDDRESAIDELTPYLDVARRPGARPQCVEMPDGRNCLVVPLPKHQRRPAAASAFFHGDSPRLLLQLANMFLQNLSDYQELEQLRNEHQAFLRQVTNDFEELTFLRGMSRLLEISDLSFDFVAMGEKMLGTLAPLLDAEALVLIVADGTYQATNDNEEAIDPLCWTGLRMISDETCRRLVQKFRAAAAIQPVVKNHLHKSPDGAEFEGVREFILVPIVTAGATIGWLLALNRDNDQNLQAAELPWGISYMEFGTHEATLMSSSAAILATHARNVELFREREDLLISVVRALVTAIEAKDEYTCGHSERVALYAKRLAKECGHDEEYCERLYLTGLLHDIGKIGVRDAVLRKPGPLSEDEFQEIKQHPDKGWQILHDLMPLQYVLEGVLYHHEQFDGRGYPDRLVGLKIPLHGRFLAVCDAFDAMTSDRPYRTGMPQEKAESILRAGAGKQWDPELIDAFFRCMPDIIAIKDTYQRTAPAVRAPRVEMHQPA